MKCLIILVALILTIAVAQTRLDIGYTLSLSASQLFVSVGEGFFEEVGIDATLSEFQTGAAVRRALLAGELDAVYMDVGRALEAKANGVGIKIVAASTQEQVSFIAEGELAQYFTEDRTPAQAFQRFIDMEGKRAQITTFPVGTVSETTLQVWLDANGVPAENVEILYMDNAQLRGALEAQAVTGTVVTEPEAGVALDALASAQVLASGTFGLVDRAGAVLVVRDELMTEQPEVVQALLDTHIRATDILKTDPERAAESVQGFVNERLEPTLITTALSNMQDSFVADPTAIRTGAQIMHDVQITTGALEQELSLDDLFDTSFFDAAQLE